VWDLTPRNETVILFNNILLHFVL